MQGDYSFAALEMAKAAVNACLQSLADLHEDLRLL